VRVVVAVAASAWMLLGPGSGMASATKAHAFSFAFAGAGAVPGEAGSLSLIHQGREDKTPGSGVAVNDVTHEVYVADTGNRRVDEFKVEEGKALFLRAWGWGVATGAPELQVCTVSCQAGLSGAEPGEFQTPAYIAVDNAATSASKGDVYVGDPGDNLVTKFDSEGHLISSWGNNGENAVHERTEPNGQLNGSPTEPFDSGFTRLTLDGIAVDGSGHLWIDNGHSRLFEFGPDGTWVTTQRTELSAGTGQGGMAANTACTEACDIYIHDGFEQIVALHPPTERELGHIVTGAGTEPTEGVALDSSDGDFYIARSGLLVEDIPASCVPSDHGCSPSQVFGEGSLNEATGLAVDPGSGAVLVGDAGNDKIAVFALVLEADIAPVAGVSAHGATLGGSVNPVGVEMSSCEFEYGTTVEYGNQVPCSESAGTIGNGTSAVPVQAPLEGLAGGTTYHFRLHANSPSGNVYSEDGSFTTVTTAVIREVSAGEVTPTGAVIKAVVNPEGLAATYHFEYGPCAAPGQCLGSPFPTRAPEPDGEIAVGSSDLTVSQRLEGLTAGATYHFRIIVTDVNGQALPTPEGTFAAAPPPPSCAAARAALDLHLPDCRAYELVTPPEKNGADINKGLIMEEATFAADGSRVFSLTLQCFDNAEACNGVRKTEGTPYSFTRSEAGWLTEPLIPPATSNSTMLSYSADTGRVLFARSAEPPALEQLDVREPDGTLRAVGAAGETPGPHISGLTRGPSFATGDMTHVVVADSEQDWPSLEGPGGNQLLAYPGTTPGRPVLVGVTGPAGSTSLISACGTNYGGAGAPGRLSGDGRATFFTDEPCSTGTGANAGVPVPAELIYQRIEEASGEMSTVLVSGPGPGSVCDAECQQQTPRQATFAGASTDGSRVFFTDTGRLTNSANDDKNTKDVSGGGCVNTSLLTSGCNLYEFACPAHCEQLSERRLVDVSAGDTSGLGPRVRGVVAFPPSGADLFFVASGVLTGKPNAGGQKPSPGAANLYVYRFAADGGEGTVGFIAQLAQADAPEWSSGGEMVANVTPDGRYLVFTSHRALTADVSREEGPAQVYRYDVLSRQLARVSIGQAGFADNGNAAQGDASIVHAHQGYATRVGLWRTNPTVSDSGDLVVFESPAGLTSGALDNHPVAGNPAVLARNVYEWAANGTQLSPNAPACAEPNGCVSLISDGRDLNQGTGEHANSYSTPLLGVDASGTNVFFWSADQLVARDTDTQIDLYDARVGGGFPEPTQPQPCSTLTACHPESELLGPPLFGPLASSLFVGAGNAPPAVQEPTPHPSSKPRSLSLAQRLALALKACAKRHGHARLACERAARRTYRAELLASALRECRRRHGRARSTCERRARHRLAKITRTRTPNR
jgi:hypothetical protein